MEQMNSVHEHHDRESFEHLRHYVFAFHDSTFECMARSFMTVQVEGPLVKVAQDMARALEAR